ncbi:nucleotide-diphospho-sugar transferase family protein [Sesbania bispinosa]|nr:nucleotide-diphospho-sugar transferase family protein [Sesbania bispinosa]
MKDTVVAVDTAAADGSKPWNSIGSSGSHVFVRRVMQIILFLVGFAVLWMFLYNSASPFGFPVISRYFNAQSTKGLEFWVLG